MLALIESGETQIDRLLIVTFTRAASADMRAKLSRELGKRAAEGDARCRREQLLLERASISTLHGFCADFLRAHFESAGVDPAFRVLDDAQVRRLRDEKYRSWEWIWGKTPTFTMERSGEFAGAPLHVGYCARRGVVSDFQLRTDALDCARAEARFNGARLDPDGFFEICAELAGPRAEALMDLLL